MAYHGTTNETNTCLHPFVCRYCSKVWHSFARFKRHLTRHRTRQHIRFQRLTGRFFGNKSSQCLQRKVSCSASQACAETNHATPMKDSINVHLHIDHGTERTLFICTKCGESFEYEEHIDKHTCRRILTAGDTTPPQCIHCGKCFTQKSNLMVHLRRHTGDDRRYRCPYCKNVYSTQFRLANHMTKHTSGDREPNKCEVCGEQFLKQSSLNFHRCLSTGASSYHCTQCGKKYCNELSWMQHKCRQGFLTGPNLMQRKNGGEKLKCPVCGKFYNEERLSRHLAFHMVDKPIKCPVCGKGFVSLAFLRPHLKRHEGNRQFQCPNCSKSYKDLGSLNRHLTKHTGERYQCDHCGKTFQHKHTLRNHTRRHTGKLIECHICGMGTDNMSALKAHIKNCHTLDKFMCSQCSEKFALKRELKAHIILVHTDELPHKCEECVRGFKTSEHLMRHLKSNQLHAGRGRNKRVLKRNTSGKILNERSQLRASHRGNPRVLGKAYQCTHCDKSFTKRRALDAHVAKLPKMTRRLVKGENSSFKCQHCDRSFAVKRSLERHIMEVHEMDGNDDLDDLFGDKHADIM